MNSIHNVISILLSMTYEIIRRLQMHVIRVIHDVIPAFIHMCTDLSPGYLQRHAYVSLVLYLERRRVDFTVR